MNKVKSRRFLIVVLVMNINIFTFCQSHSPSFFASVGLSYFSEFDLAGPTVSLDLQFPLNNLFTLNAGLESSNAHAIDYIGGEEGVYLINCNSISGNIGFTPIHGKNNLEVSIGGLFHYTGYSLFLYKDVRNIENDQIVHIREYYSSGRNSFSYKLETKYYYLNKNYKYGIKIQYINFANTLSCSLLFGIILN